jgi:hypothetical protein
VPDATPIEKSLDALSEVGVSLLRLLEAIRLSECTDSQKGIFENSINRMLVLCEQATAELLKQPESATLGKTLPFSDEIRRTGLSIDEQSTKRHPTLSYRIGERYQFCPDRALAIKIQSAVVSISDLIDKSIDCAMDSSLKGEALQSLKISAGALHGENSTVGIMAFLDHPDLVPDEDWKEMLEDNRETIKAKAQGMGFDIDPTN